MDNSNLPIRAYISGSRRFSNIFWATAVSFGGMGFFVAGIRSYLQLNILSGMSNSEISFIPQGIVLVFYGSVGTILGAFLWLTIWWDIGFGYNEFDRNSNTVSLYRKGFPGSKREFKLVFFLTEIKSIKMKIIEGLNSRRQLLLCLSDGREIPLTGIDSPVVLSNLENQAIKLSKYLNVYLETN